MKRCQLFTIEPGVRDGHICYLRSPIGWLQRKDDRVCVKGIRDWQDGIYSSGNKSWRWKGSLGGLLLSAMPPLCSAIGYFHPTTTDSPFQPSQLVKKRPSCLAFPDAVYQRQIFLIVKKCSAVHSGPLCRGEIVYPPFSYSLSLCFSSSTQYKLFPPCLIQ